MHVVFRSGIRRLRFARLVTPPHLNYAFAAARAGSVIELGAMPALGRDVVQSFSSSRPGEPCRCLIAGLGFLRACRKLANILDLPAVNFVMRSGGPYSHFNTLSIPAMIDQIWCAGIA